MNSDQFYTNLKQIADRQFEQIVDVDGDPVTTKHPPTNLVCIRKKGYIQFLHLPITTMKRIRRTLRKDYMKRYGKVHRKQQEKAKRESHMFALRQRVFICR